jgi:hypothetical protein
VDRATKQPLNEVLVTLTAPNRPRASSHTDKEGRFQFSGVANGKYIFQVWTRDHSERYLQYEGFSTALVVGTGQKLQGIVFPVDHRASLRGAIKDEYGDPIFNAHVYLVRQRVLDGEIKTLQDASASADRDGTFLINGLQSGAYQAVIVAKPWHADNAYYDRSHPDERDVAYPITYYGGATDPTLAKPIILRAGDAMEISIVLRAVPALHVALPATYAEGNTRVKLFTSGPGAFPILTEASMSSITDTSGVKHVEIEGVTPGDYRVELHRYEAKGEVGTARIGHLHVPGQTSLPDTALRQAPTIVGEVAIQDSNRLGAAEQPSLKFSCAKTSFIDPSVADSVVRIGRNGKFTLQNQTVAPGLCRVYLVNFDSAYIDTILLDGAPQKDNIFQVPPDAALSLKIVTKPSAALGQLNGIVIDGAKPFPAATVLLVPADQSRPSLLRRDQSDSDGSFVLRAVVPGKYILLALDDGESLAYREPGVLKPYLATGTPLDFPLADAKPVSVKLQKRRR